MTRRRSEPSRLDRALQAVLIACVVGAILGGGYVVVNLDEFVTPVRPGARPAEVSATAVWHGERGYQEGLWVDCELMNPDGTYRCRTWRDSGSGETSTVYRFVGEGPPPARPAIDRWAPPTLTLEGGGRLERLPPRGVGV